MIAKNIYKMFNETTRKHEEIDLNEAELLPGQIVVKMFFVASDSRYVTIPGASLFTVTETLDLELVAE
jgi:hypothetical protein